MNRSFQDVVATVRGAFRPYQEQKDAYNLACYVLAFHIACREKTDVLEVDGWRASMPDEPAPAKIFDLKFVKAGFATTLGALAGLVDRVHFSRRLHKGGVIFARRALQAGGFASVETQHAEARRRLQEMPAENMLGHSTTTETYAESTYCKYHWPQVAWADFLKENAGGAPARPAITGVGRSSTPADKEVTQAAKQATMRTAAAPNQHGAATCSYQAPAGRQDAERPTMDLGTLQEADAAVLVSAPLAAAGKERVLLRNTNKQAAAQSISMRAASEQQDAATCSYRALAASGDGERTEILRQRTPPAAPLFVEGLDQEAQVDARRCASTDSTEDAGADYVRRAPASCVGRVGQHAKSPSVRTHQHLTPETVAPTSLEALRAEEHPVRPLAKRRLYTPEAPQRQLVLRSKRRRLSNKEEPANDAIAAHAQHNSLLERTRGAGQLPSSATAPLAPTAELRVKDAGMFECRLSDVVEMLDLQGVATVTWPGFANVALAAATDAEEFVSTAGEAIFEVPEFRPNGTVRTHRNGEPMLSTGTSQRVQAYIKETEKPTIHKVVQSMRDAVGVVLASRESSAPAMDMQDPVVLGNNPVRPGDKVAQPVGPQCLHTDMEPGSKHSFFVMASLENDTFVRVAPQSHHTIHCWLQQANSMQRAGGDGGVQYGDSTDDDDTSRDVDNDDTDSSQSARQDEDSAAHCTSSNGDERAGVTQRLLPYTQLKTRFAGMAADDAPIHRVFRLRMQPGQLIFLHGNVVHAGDAGKPGLWTPRVHCYVQEQEVKNATYPIAVLHPRFTAKFTV